MDADLEPGLLRIFRLFSGLEALAFLGIVISYATLPDRPFGAPDTRFVVDFLASAVLFGYLSWLPMQRLLRRFYLPLALGFATLVPIINSRVYLEISTEANLPLLILSAWELIPLLFVPLVLTAWQYGLHAVLVFCALPSLLDVSLALAIADRLHQAPFRILSVILIRAASLFVVGYIVAQLMRTQREQRRALVQANALLGQHAQTLEQLTISRERNRLARELHDTLAHTLSGLVVNLEAFKTELEAGSSDTIRLLNDALAITRSGLTETRRALKDLRASPLEDLGLALALQALAQTAAARGNLELTLDLPGDSGPWPPVVEQNLYRVAQEALENVIQHARARQVTVRLTGSPVQVNLSIVDDGVGFDTAAETTGHFGLRGMRERAALLGGQLTITSQAGAGTRVNCRVEVARG